MREKSLHIVLTQSLHLGDVFFKNLSPALQERKLRR